MRTTSRILTAAAGLLALAAVPIFGCGDAGDDGGNPTGATQQYTPGMDLAGSTLTAQAIGTARQGGTFDIIATFRDGAGRPVEGMAILVADEEGAGCFAGPTNPSLTDAGGTASILVFVDAFCVPESYTLTVFTAPGAGGPRVEAFVHVSVKRSDIAAVSDLTLETTTPAVTLPGQATFVATVFATPACSLRVQYQASGAGISVPVFTDLGPLGFPTFSLSPSLPGTLTVIVLAFCDETGPAQGLVSDPVEVTVTAAP